MARFVRFFVFGILFLISPLSAQDSQQGNEASFRFLSPEQTGIDLVCRIDVNHPLRRIYYSSSACGGMVAADFSGNGSPELFFVDGPGKNRLFSRASPPGKFRFSLFKKKESPFRYRDITGKANLVDQDRWGVGAAAADIDNDGDLDLYVCNYDAPNQLWINETPPGSEVPVFKEDAFRWGLDIVDASIMPAFADFDRDGLLDVYLLNFRLYREGGRPEGNVQFRVSPDGKVGEVIGENARYYRYGGLENGKHTFTEAPRRDRLLRNNGRHFEDVSAKAGVGLRAGYGNSVSWWDMNRDGYPDIFVGNDFSDPDVFYLNNGDGTFTEVLGLVAPSSAWTSMGSAVLDLDNNGWTELIMGDMSATTHYKNKLFMGEMGSGLEKIMKETGPRQLPRNALYLNLGANRLLDVAHMAGVAATDWTWAIQAEDFDHDGWQDLFFANGMVRQFTHADLTSFERGRELVGKNMFDFFVDHPELREKNIAFRNRGDLSFENVSEKWGLNQESMSFGACATDLDRDGDLDLIVTNLEEPPFILENRASRGNSIQVQLRGKKSNRFGIGATVEIRIGKEQQTRSLFTSGGFLSTDEPIAHFGIGSAKKVDRLRVTWPSGAIQLLSDLEGGKIHTVEEPNDAPDRPGPVVMTDMPAPLYAEAVVPVGQLEEKHDDFVTQPLLPKSHSQLGPGAAWGDVTGDGISDLIYSGSRGKSTRVFRRQKPENARDAFKIFPHKAGAPVADTAPETLGVLLFDADGDGDQDLYFANGSVEAAAGDPNYQDKLFLNDGSGFFSSAPESLPALTESSFSVAAADYDRDGDLDLAVATRLVPGEYPKPATSRLLQNDGTGKFSDVTKSAIPGFIETGMVTSLLWTDVNDDGWLDLLAAHEWGPIKTFLNNQSGVLVDKTEDSGIADRLGWWQGLHGRDLNGDGLIDYVASNFGTNTIYHASPEKPELIYFGDMEGKGRFNIIEAKFEGKICYPRRGYSCSSRAMPGLKEKIKTFEQFATTSLSDLYTPEKLEPALKLECNTLESVALINEGRGRFKMIELPWMAQVSPSFGVVLTDVDADGFTDVFLAQNFSHPQRETGPMNGGISALLKGTGEREAPFVPATPLESGLLVPEDARSVAVCDVNHDARPDLFIGINDAHPSVFINQAKTGRPFTIRLKGNSGNPTAIGAKVTLVTARIQSQSAEVYGGSGYLSQSEPILYFAAPEGAKLARINIRWPDGTEEKRDVDLKNTRLVIEQN